MDDATPIACSLTPRELRDRRSAWTKIGRYGSAAGRIPGGLRFTFSAAPGVYESLRQLVALEADCCAWMAIKLEAADGIVVMELTAEGPAGEGSVREMFASLFDEVSGGRPSAARP